MARLWQCGFEQNTLTSGVEITSTSGGPTISSTTFRAGAYAARISSLSFGTEKSISYKFNYTDINGPLFFRACFRFATLPSQETRIMALKNSSSTTRAYITIDSSGVLKLYDGAGQITGTTTLSTNTWYVIEMQYDASGSGSTDTLNGRVDGTQFAGSSTRNHSSGINTFTVGGNLNSEAGTTGDWFIDDLAVNDNTGSSQNSYPGLGRVIHLKPNAAGDANSFATEVGGTAGSSNHYTRVNENTPDDATSYNSSNTLSQEDLFNVDASGLSSSDTIVLVGVGLRLANITATDFTAIKPEILKTSGGTILQGTAVSPLSTSWITNRNPSASPANYNLIAYTDPDAAAWTNTTLDSMQIGYKITSGGTRHIAVSSVWASVEYIPISTVTTTKTVTGKSRIQKSVTQTITGKSRVQKSASSTILGKSRVGITSSRTITGLSRISVSTLKTLLGKAAIRNVVNKTISGISRVQKNVLKTIQGVARITIVTTQSILGKARITNTTINTILGKASIITDKIYSKGSPSSLPVDDTNLTAFTTNQISYVASDDSDYTDNQVDSPNFNVFQFKNKNTNNTDTITINWKGKTDRLPSTSTVYLQVYNRTSGLWENLDSDNSSSAGADFTLTGSISSNLSDYYDGSYFISCRVYQEVK